MHRLVVCVCVCVSACAARMVRLQECTLRNTDWILGVAIYTGHQTKISLQNQGSAVLFCVQASSRLLKCTSVCSFEEFFSDFSKQCLAPFFSRCVPL